MKWGVRVWVSGWGKGDEIVEHGVEHGVGHGVV